MDKDELINLLIINLTITRLTLAQVLCNRLNPSQSIDAKAVSHDWKILSKNMSHGEQIAGKRALCQYFQIDMEDNGRQALILGWPYDINSRPNRMYLSGNYRRRENTTSADLKLALDNTREEFIPRLDDQDQLTLCDKESKYWIRRLYAAWKNRVLGEIK